MSSYDDYGMLASAYSESESLTHQAFRVVRAFFLYRVRPWIRARVRGNWNWKSILSLGRILIVIWCITLYWGERSVFDGSLDRCRWEDWEKWEQGANPHRLVFVADPQLVDPHTYPGRPWPLSTLTVKHTDLYLRRTYSRIQKILYPDSIVFLGDLFDGGREWSTRTTQSPEQQYRKYGNAFWLNEYDRFGSIFFGHWGDAGLEPRPGQPGKKIISSLPGNHDLGFGPGIQSSVRKRYNAYFGEGNRIDVIGNHTFVSIDAVSLSARDQQNADTIRDLWEPTVKFLDKSKKLKQRLVQEELRLQRGLTRNLPFTHNIIEQSDIASAALPKFQEVVSEFPTILLSHVPLYRSEGTPCGPLREHWPPTPPPDGQTEPLEKDERNAIAVRGGYQYQNVLSREITKDVAEKIGDIQYAFSGDDHDYCEVTHRGYASGGGGIREITVKSISWAMGVRYPGIVLVSLWNPVDEKGEPLATDKSRATLDTKLCLFPDQLGIFIRYATLFGMTIAALGMRAALVAGGTIKSTQHSAASPLLPTTTMKSSAENEKANISNQSQQLNHKATSSNSTSSKDRGHLQVRSARARSVSTANGHAHPTSQASPKFTYPLIQHAGYYGPSEEEEKKTQPKSWGSVSTKSRKPKKKRTGCGLFLHELLMSVLGVGSVVFAWYFWLIWTG